MKIIKRIFPAPKGLFIFDLLSQPPKKRAEEIVDALDQFLHDAKKGRGGADVHWLAKEAQNIEAAYCRAKTPAGFRVPAYYAFPVAMMAKAFNRATTATEAQKEAAGKRLEKITNAVDAGEMGVDSISDWMICEERRNVQNADRAAEARAKGGRNRHKNPKKPPEAEQAPAGEESPEPVLEDSATAEDGGMKPELPASLPRPSAAVRVPAKGGGAVSIAEALAPPSAPSSPPAPAEAKKKKSLADMERDILQPQLANPKEGIRAIDAALLTPFMVAYCREQDPAQARAALAIKFRKLGADDFREEAATFIAETEAGEEPDNRGAVFMARLNEALKTKNRNPKTERKQ